MIRSMTGFGRASGRVLDREITVELKAVNNRFKEVVPRLPKTYTLFEEPVRKLVGDRIDRGRVDIFVQIDECANRRQRLKLDLDLAATYCGLVRQLKKDLDLAGEPDLAQVAGFKDVIAYRDEELDAEAFMAGFQPLLTEALDKLVQMRQIEGKTIAGDMEVRLRAMSVWADEIEFRRGAVMEETRSRLETRIAAITEGMEIDPWRLAQEAAFLADRSDVTEEIVRLRSHLDQLGRLLNDEGSVGRRMDFLIQEVNREINTIGSKSQDVEITNRVVDLKTEMEKLREQVQNVE